MNTIVRYPVSLSNLLQSTYVFRRVKENIPNKQVRLLPNGVISGYSHKNECAWKIINGYIAFLDDSGEPSTIFDGFEIVEGKIVLFGKFLKRAPFEITHQLCEVDIWDLNRPRHEPNTKNFLMKFVNKYGWSIGDHTYGKPTVLEPHLAKLIIGKFCSIAGSVCIVLGNHRVDTVSTYPFLTLKKYWPSPDFSNESDHHTKGDVVIGNDVWIAQGTTILSGITIGDGAVIAANSVVTKNIPPYAIVAGNPARIIRYRFDEATIKKLLEIRWWDFDDEKIDDLLPVMYRDVNEFVQLFDSVY